MATMEQHITVKLRSGANLNEILSAFSHFGDNDDSSEVCFITEHNHDIYAKIKSIDHYDQSNTAMVNLTGFMRIPDAEHLFPNAIPQFTEKHTFKASYDCTHCTGILNFTRVISTDHEPSNTDRRLNDVHVSQIEKIL